MKILNVNYGLNDVDFDRIFLQWNDTNRPFPIDKTIHQLFEEQVEKTPENIALVFGSESLTYRQLNQRANQLAVHLRREYKAKTAKDLQPNTLIALRLERSLEMVISVLAVLKAGGAYVPIEPGYPQDRMNFILDDIDAQVILTQKHLVEALPSQVQYVITDLDSQYYQNTSTLNLDPYATAQDLAYVIYTSGTTGRPKGVMIPHRGIVNRLTWMQAEYPLSEQDVVLQKTPYVFDVSVWELFWAHWYGARLVMAKPDGHKDSSYLYQLINKERVTTLHFVPSMLDAYNAYLIANELRINKSIKTMFCSGEALQSITVNQTYSNSNNEQFRLHNLYGPTEASIDVTYYATQAGHAVFIGKPIANTRTYILDEEKCPVAVGAVGELYLGGAGLALGYLNREELTAERFVENDFATEDDIKNGYTKLYKTGDLAQWTEDGYIAYRGRNDDQVKIRGYRIELGEIESRIREVVGIEQACVLAKTRDTDIGSNKYLVAYYSVRAGHDTAEVKIVSALSKYLPDYMVPNIFVRLENFPLTVNGKLDKKSLPEPALTDTESYIEPSNELELEICSIWEKVLRVEKVGVTDNFFKIGGDSILAILLSAKMSELLDYEVNVADILKYRNIKNIMADAPKNKKIVIPRVEQETSTLSYAQERLWFVEQYEEATSAYHIPCLYKLSATANVEWVKKAIQAVVDRHAILRTTIEQSDNHDIQRIHASPLVIKEQPLTVAANYAEIVSREINTPFDLKNEYPIKVTLYQVLDDEPHYLLLVNFHHIATDGWSIDIFERDFQYFYNAYATKQEPTLPALSIQYMDYAVWQRDYLQQSINQDQVNYWKAKLAGYPTLELQTDYPRPNRICYQGKHECFSIDAEISRALRALAKQSNCTLHTVTLSIFSLLLSKYCHQTDIVTGTPIANRHFAQTQDLIGLFINVQVNRVEIDSDQTFKELIQKVQQDQVEAQKHQDIPFEKIVEELDVERDISRHPIFQIMFGVQGFGEINPNNSREHSNPLIPCPSLNDIYEYARFDMEFFIDDRQDDLHGIIRYASKLFKPDTIRQLILHYKFLVEEIIKSGDVKIEAINMLSNHETKKLTIDWNKTDKEFPKNKTIYSLFEEQALRTPDSIAVSFEGTSLTYADLNDKANRLARKIRTIYQQRVAKTLQPDTLIALYLDRSVEMMVAVLAVLKAGAAYVPIDPGYPMERCRFMLEDTQSELILTLKSIVNNHSRPVEDNLTQQGYAQSKLLVIDLDEPLYQQMDGSNLEPYANADHLAYVIYTSGTTGKPKGAMLPHRGVVNRIMWMQSMYPLSSTDVVLQKTPYVFDVSVWELFWAHWYGAKLVLAKPDGHKDSNYLNSLIISENITTLHFVPSMLEAYNGFLLSNRYGLPGTIKQMFCSGEALYETTVNQIYDLAQNPTFRLHNLYGPTEASIDVTYFETQKGKPVLIGKPIDNIRTYILDENKHVVPVGVVGELYLGGVGLARGYLNRPELTAERFVENTFSTETDLQNGYTKLYKTGDLVRWLPDGNIAYIGRNDDQVKIRGHRIELDEIANKLRSIAGINQACVLVKKRETSSGVSLYLVAYYTETQTGLINDESLLSELAKELPDYMLPGAFVRLEAFPLTINGKLDRRLLPDPVLNNSKNFVAPRDSLETALCHIWQEVLGLDQVGVTDNFFRMGGDSILAIRVVYLCAQKGYHLGVVNLFLSPTIERLADYIRNSQDQLASSVVSKDYQTFSLVDHARLPYDYQSQFEDIYPVSYTQLGIISENLKHERLTHTDNFHFKVLHPYSPEKVRATLFDLLTRHELLRSVINSSPEYDFLICNKKAYLAEDYIYIHQLSLEEYQVFDGEAFGHARFANDPVLNDMGQTLFQLHVITCEQDTSSFILVGLFNHVIADGWSLNLFSSQFMQLYLGEDKPVFANSMKYAEFVANEQGCVANNTNKAFWLNYLRDYERRDNLVLRSSIQLIEHEVAPTSVRIDILLIEKAYKLCEKLQINIDIIFMAATYAFMSKFMASDDVTVGYVQNNRPEQPGSENTFGYFLNLVPFRINYQGNDSTGLLDVINAQRNDILKYKQYPYPLMQKELGLSEAIFNMAFNYISFKGIDEYAGKDIDIYMNTGLEDVPAYVEVRDMNGEFSIQLNFK
ncbi:TPA: amino acid adenylation domain-containing protein, partial [Salmonella enterica subsp. enterica serovar Weltevreden]